MPSPDLSVLPPLERLAVLEERLSALADSHRRDAEASQKAIETLTASVNRVHDRLFVLLLGSGALGSAGASVLSTLLGS